MSALHPVLLWLHLLGVILWIGGMLFAHLCLRPAALELAPPLRLPLWCGVLGRFFRWVWLALGLVLASGGGLMAVHGAAGMPWYWHAMATGGLVMAVVYISIQRGPWPALQKAVAAQDWPAGGAAMNQIRQRVGFNLLLGLLVVSLATLGPLLG